MVAGATDMQKPHDEDEAYFVIRGQAKMKLGEEERKIGPGMCFMSVRPSRIASSRSKRTWMCSSSLRKAMVELI